MTGSAVERLRHHLHGIVSPNPRRATSILVVHAHPVADSYSAAIRDRAVHALRADHHEVDVLDLYRPPADDVDGAAGSTDAPPAGDTTPDDATPDDTAPDETRPDATPAGFVAGLPGVDADEVDGMRRRLEAAHVLVLVYPTWWSGPPAVLGAWYASVLDPALGRARSVRRVIVLTTHGSSKWVNLAQGEGGRLVARRALRTVLHPLVRVRWVALYGMDRCTDEDRRGYLDRVERAMHLL
ncbi:MAG: NAD(P)H-dependent oxidoreductase [Actinomycetota bacterium]|nr:NAD(P)H-dependent oxidoreductase [Actinomycetota bacterium]